MHLFVWKKRSILTKIVVIILLIVLITLFTIGYFKGNIMPVITTMSESTVRSLAVDAINTAAHIVIDSEIKYDDLVNIVKNNNGDIDLIETNTFKINKLSRDLAILAQNNVSKISKQTISLPIGAFTGSIVLAGFGPSVEVELLPIGSVICDFVSNFEEVGINQTKHSIYINANTTISIVLPVSSVPVSVSMSILVVENIIVGKVPSVYFNSNSQDDRLNLIPR